MFCQVIEITAGLDKVSSPVHLDISNALSSLMSSGNSIRHSTGHSTGISSVHSVLIGLALLPLGQSLDQDYPTSHTITEHGALLYLILLVSLIMLSIVWRRRYPLFCFGLLMFLIWLAPTSSIVPIDDALVERRMRQVHASHW